MYCFECNEGEYVPIVDDYHAVIGTGRNGEVVSEITIPNIAILTCDHCGDQCLDSENSKKIDDAREQYIKANTM
jgi:hypothetical protein